MNSFDQETGVFHCDDPPLDFTIEMDGSRPGSEMFRIHGAPPPDWSMPEACDEAELLKLLGRFFGTNDESLFHHIIERIKMNNRQADGAEPQVGSFI
jgi:hypothetical protein